MTRRRKGNSTGNQSQGLDIPEEEQWRLINESGLLKKPFPGPAPDDGPPALADAPAEEGTSLVDEIFNATMLIIPFSFLLLLMEILVHQQYREIASLAHIMERMGTGIPFLSVFIFYTTRYKAHRRMQFALLVLSLVVGMRMIYTVNKLSWKVVLVQCPPMATVWVYTIVQLELLPAVISLAIVAGWVWWKDLKLLL